MKTKNLLNTIASMLLVSSTTAFADNISNQPKRNSEVINFIENKGQVHDQNNQPRPDVLYGAMAGNMAVHIKNNGVSYQLYRIDKWKEVKDVKSKKTLKEIDQQTIYRIDLAWLNANKNFTKSEDKTLPGFANYYTDNSAFNVKSYTGIFLNNLYNGINLHYYEKNGYLKHDYIVAPHANYKQIQLKVEGAAVKLSNDGTLLLTTPLGKIQEGAPIVYQNGRQLAAKWVLKNNVLSFEIENYNPSLELIIDPVTRAWGTYYGDTGNETGRSCTTDASGNVYIAGYTPSGTGTIIATSGSHQSTTGGSFDAFLSKFNNSGVRQWATFYGGSGLDLGLSCAADIVGNVYLSGRAASTGTAIATAGSHQSANGGGDDAFLVKFNSSGVRQWATFYGGTDTDEGDACTVDASGNVYMSGYTDSNTGTVIATAGAHQTTTAGGFIFDAFLVKFNSSGVRQWGTYYGDNGGDEYGNSCAADASGNVYLAGITNASTGTVIATVGSHQSVVSGGDDAFLVKFNSSGVRQWGTYYGGLGIDAGSSCVTDASGNVFLTGYTGTNTGTVIATSGSHQSSYGLGTYDAYLVKFNTSGVRQWGTYYGGAGFDYALSCATDATGNIYMAGYTSTNFSTVIATPGSHQTTYGGGTNDAYLVKFNNGGIRQWGTYYGGSSNVDYGYSCAIDAANGVYLAGITSSSTGTIIASASSHQPTFGGGQDAFLTRFVDCTNINPTAAVNSTVCTAGSLNFTANVTGTTIPTYSWSGPTSFTSNIQNPVISAPSLANIGVYTVTTNNGGCIETATTQVTNVYSSPNIVVVGTGTVCSGNAYTITLSGANTYTIQGGSAVVSPTASTSYTVIGTSTAGCVSPNTATANVTVFTTPTVAVNSGGICLGSSFTITPSGANTYTIQGGATVVSPTTNASYTVVGTSTAGCVSANTATSNITVNAIPTVAVNSGSICSGNSFTIVPAGANTYTIQGGTAIVSPTANASYTVVGTSTAGCVSANTATSNVTVNSLPIVNAITSSSLICVGQTATLTASGASTYTWNTSATTNAIAITPSVTTTYTVTGTNSNGCSANTVVTQSVSACTGFNNVSGELNGIEVYPNPNNGLFFVQVSSDVQIEVIDVLGKSILNQKVESGKYELNISDYANGVYFVRLKSSDASKTIKIVKQ